jgi:hypothetical protein
MEASFQIRIVGLSKLIFCSVFSFSTLFHIRKKEEKHNELERVEPSRSDPPLGR